MDIEKAVQLVGKYIFTYEVGEQTIQILVHKVFSISENALRDDESEEYKYRDYHEIWFDNFDECLESAKIDFDTERITSHLPTIKL